ncbi:MAG: hypothetical protein EOO14_04805 [Chitinophagaceae bacterium]|nr:MAG: hypothetical protein EOO14_04805 [Chitinophagaceae bacterium]
MKKSLLWLACMLLLVAGNTQQLPLPLTTGMTDVELAQNYLQKSKNQKIAGAVLASGGLVMMTIGMLEALSNMDLSFSLFGEPSPVKESKNAGKGFGIAGGIALVSSLPFLLASRSNGRKARLLTKNQTTQITPSFRISQATVGIAFPIGR